MRIIALATCYNRPAKPIRKRFTDEQIDKLLKIKWWNMDINSIRLIAPKMTDIGLFIRSVTDKS